MKRHELITGDGNGKVVIWCIKNGQPVHAWEAHKSEITQMQYDEETRVLITCGKDKAIRIWKLPEKWVEEEIEKYVKTEIKQQKDTKAMLWIQKKLTKIIEDSDDDDLNGWDVKPR